MTDSIIVQMRLNIIKTMIIMQLEERNGTRSEIKNLCNEETFVVSKRFRTLLRLSSAIKTIRDVIRKWRARMLTRHLENSTVLVHNNNF